MNDEGSTLFDKQLANFSSEGTFSAEMVKLLKRHFTSFFYFMLLDYWDQDSICVNISKICISNFIWFFDICENVS
jgi:hypothetical protein